MDPRELFNMKRPDRLGAIAVGVLLVVAGALITYILVGLKGYSESGGTLILLLFLVPLAMLLFLLSIIYYNPKRTPPPR